MDLLTVRTIPNERILHLRAIIRILQTDKFETAFGKANKEEKKKLYIIIFNSNKDLLNEWIKNILKNEVEEKNIHELRAEALRLGIKNATRLSKKELQWLTEGGHYEER